MICNVRCGTEGRESQRGGSGGRWDDVEWGGGGIGHPPKKKIDRKTNPIGVMPDIFSYYADRPKYIK